jgi:hypothetical protein
MPHFPTLEAAAGGMNFFGGIHGKRPAPDHGLMDRLPPADQQAQPGV